LLLRSSHPTQQLLQRLKQGLQQQQQVQQRHLQQQQQQVMLCMEGRLGVLLLLAACP
jgi:hypothetical protein